MTGYGYGLLSAGLMAAAAVLAAPAQAQAPGFESAVIKVTCDRDCLIDHARDYVKAQWLMLQQETPQDYVIATNTAYTVEDLCRVAFECVGMDWREHVAVDERFLRPTEIAPARGDYAKAARELGWTPRTDFETLIRLMVEADMALLARNPTVI